MKRAWLSVLLLGTLSLVSTGSAAWILARGNRNVSSVYDSAAVLQKYYGESMTVEYSGSPVVPSVVDPSLPNADKIAAGVSIQYAKASDSFEPTSAFAVNAPVDSGKYVARISLASGAYHDVKISIAPIVLRVQPSFVINIDYDSTKRTFANAILPSLEGIPFINSRNEPFPFTEYVIPGMDNGMYYYPNDAIKTSHAGIYKTFVDDRTKMSTVTEPGASNVVGSTYAVSLVSTNKNVEISNRCILKYKTALIGTGTTHYTVEDAIESAGSSTITFEGNSTSDKSYVTTSFCSLSLSENPYSSKYDQTKGVFKYSVPSKMVVNYQSGIDTAYGKSPSSASGGNVYSCLVIPLKFQLNVPSGKELVVNGVLGYTQPQAGATLARGVLLNEGSIECGGVLRSHGYIKGSGSITCTSGAQAYDVFRHWDWCGGTAATAMVGTVLPINAWSIHNISCPLKIEFGAQLYAEYYGWGGNAISTVLIISKGSDKCIFSLTSGAYIVKKTQNAASNEMADDLRVISKSNQVKGQKEVAEIYGKASDSSFSLTISSVPLSASTSMAVPVAYMDVILKGKDENNAAVSTELTISKSDFLFLPGTKVVIENGAKLITSSSADVFFETVAHISTANTNCKGSKEYAPFYQNCVDKTDAKMLLNGTCEANSAITGLIETTETTGRMVTKSSFKAGTFYSYFSTSSPRYYKVENCYSKAFIGSSTSQTNFKASSTYNSQGTYFAGTGGNASNLDGTYSEPSSSCIVSGTLVTGSGGDGKRVDELQVGDCLRVWDFERGQYGSQPIILIEKTADVKTYFKLHLSNGESLGICWGQGFFDVDLKNYIKVYEDNVSEYIGHRILVEGEHGPESAAITSYEIVQETVDVYEIITAFDYNFFANGIMTFTPLVPDGTFFEVGDNYAYDPEQKAADISKYGIYEYDDFAELLSPLQFAVTNTPYWKIAVAKGLCTEEDVYKVIDMFLSLDHVG